MSNASMRHGQYIGRSSEMAYLDKQETSSVVGTDIAFTNGIYEVVGGGSVRTKCASKGVRLRAGSAGGVLAVHLADNPANQIDYYDLIPGEKYGIGFDKIIQAGTTVALDANFYVLV